MKKGEVVIAKTNSPEGDSFQFREKEKAYRIVDTMKCEACHLECINIGETSDVAIMECSCGHFQPNLGLKWTSTEHFEPVSSTNKNEAIAFALREEDYELCAKFRDL